MGMKTFLLKEQKNSLGIVVRRYLRLVVTVRNNEPNICFAT